MYFSAQHMLDDEHLATHNVHHESEISIEMSIQYARPPPPAEYRLPDRIHVHCADPDGQRARVVVVDIERMPAGDHKPYLGGFRHRQTGLTYHHAAQQTVSTKPKPEPVLKFERQSQTQELTSCSMQTLREAGTQVARRGVWIDGAQDVERIARPYFTADQLHALRHRCATTIQCAVRCWIARRRVSALRQRRYEQELELMRAQDEHERQLAERQQRELQRRMHPRTAADFDLLYSELEAWRVHETARIKGDRQLPEAERQSQLQQLLQKETKLLQTIDRLKIAAKIENHEAKIKNQLTAMAAPKTWTLKGGDTAVVHTPFTTRAQELAQLYNGLRLNGLAIEERLDVLLHAKWTVKEFDCRLTRECVELIDREIDMLKRGRGESSLTGLRKRLGNLFLQFIETPEFNPESAQFKKTAVAVGTNTKH
jgi:hypothetical protein